MNLHHASRQPDWEKIPAEAQNRWQRVAASTNGRVTPGNVISLLGASLSLAGIAQALNGNYLPAIALLVIGRGLDGLDGAIADYTGTKSQLGKLVDASLDKIVIFAALLGLWSAGLLPLWLALSILVLNALNVLATYFAKRQQLLLQPSAAGKIAMLANWVAITLYVIANLPALRHGPTVHTAALSLALLAAITALAIGTRATVGYLTVAWAADRHQPLAPVFDRYVVVRNPTSTESHRAQARIYELRTLQPAAELTVLDTRAGGREQNRHLLENLRDKLGPRTLLCIAAGDGTVNMVLNLLMHEPHLSAQARSTPILPLWCGNANDLAHMLNGHASRATMRRLLRHGNIVTIHPIACTLTAPAQAPVTYLAACYASFGATAYATEELERTVRKSPMRRFGGTRFGREVIAVFRALIEAPTFTITQQQQRKTIFERTYFNGSRFAKVIGVPLLLTDRAFHMTMIEHKRFMVVLLHILGFATGRDRSRVALAQDQFTVQDDVWAQFDGEAVHVPAGTHIELTVAEQTFRALSTRLPT